MCEKNSSFSCSTSCSRSAIRLNDRESWPISSRLLTGSGFVNAPSASWAVATVSPRSARVMCRVRKPVAARATATAASIHQ